MGSSVFMDRWGAVLAERGDAAGVLAPDGRVLRRFSEIEQEAEALARELGGVVPGSTVSLRAANVAEWPGMVLGIWRAGMAALLVDATLPGSAVVAAERNCGVAARVELGGVRRFASPGVADQAAAGRGEAVGLVKLTSGTTGAARALRFTAEAVVADCDQVCETMGISGDDVNYGVVAFSHSYGFSNLVTPLLFRGVPVVVAGDALPRAMWDGVAASGATVLPAVPVMFRALGELGAGRHRLRRCISAGAPLPVRTARDFWARQGLKIHSFYGASECGGICFDSSEDVEVPEGFVGEPMVGVTVRRRAGEGAGEVTGEFGIEVVSRALSLDVGPAFAPSDLLAAAGPRGYRVCGRETDLVNLGGRKVNPVDVETVLRAHPVVRDCVVVGRAGGERSDILVAVVVLSAPVGDADLRAHCARHLAGWQVPREFVRSEGIPVGARGKVNRREVADALLVGLPDAPEIGRLPLEVRS